MGRLHNVSIKAQDSSSVDAMGRWRVSNPVTIFDGKQIFDNLPLFWDESLESGSGITAAHDPNTASTIITSTLDTAGVFTRRTYMRFNYSPGKSQLIYMTGVLNKSGGGAGVVRRIGQFDDNNGLFFEYKEGVAKVVRRTNVTGTPFDDAKPQTEWNVDKMDGDGPSGLTITNWDKFELFAFNYKWLGGGPALYGLVVDNMLLEVHRFPGADSLSTVFMSTPNLPASFQMITTSSSPVSELSATCATVISEGGTPDLGNVRYASTRGTHVDADAENTIYAIIGIRLKSTHLGATIKILKASAAEHAGAKEFEWFLAFNPEVAGTFTYGPEPNSAIEVARGAITNVVTIGAGTTLMDGGYGSSAKQGGNQTNEEVDSARRLGASIAGAHDTIVLCVRPVGGSTGLDIEGSITWRELS